MKLERFFLKALSSSQMLNYPLKICIHSKILFIMEPMQYINDKILFLFSWKSLKLRIQISKLKNVFLVTWSAAAFRAF